MTIYSQKEYPLISIFFASIIFIRISSEVCPDKDIFQATVYQALLIVGLSLLAAIITIMNLENYHEAL